MNTVIDGNTCVGKGVNSPNGPIRSAIMITDCDGTGVTNNTISDNGRKP